MGVWIGIDPGKKGGIAIVDSNGNLLKAIPMPENMYDFKEILPFKSSIRHIFIEKAQSMPRQGVVSMFTYGKHFGLLQGVLIGMNLPFTLIPPKEWQKKMFVGTESKSQGIRRNPKDRALEAANRIFRKETSFWQRSKRSKLAHDGIIDASLIAEACRRMIG